MYMSTFFVRIVLEASVSLNRLQDFLCKTELLDEYESKKPQGEAPVVNVADEPQWIGFRSATFGWSKDQKASSADFRLVLDNVEFKRGAINLVVWLVFGSFAEHGCRSQKIMLSWT